MTEFASSMVVDDSPITPRAMITSNPMSMTVMIRVKPDEDDVALVAGLCFAESNKGIANQFGRP